MNGLLSGFLISAAACFVSSVFYYYVVIPIRESLIYEE